MKKNELIKIISTGVICLIIGVIFGGAGNVSLNKYEALEDDKKTIEEKLNAANKLYEEKCNDYLELDQETQLYRGLTDSEKEIVDAKINEVKQATKEQQEAEQKAIEEAKAQKAAEEQAKKEAEEQAKKEAEAHKYETGLTWEDIAREGKIGTLGQFEGKIIQVMNGTGYKQYRVAINGDYNTIMLIQVNDGVANETLLEDDYVYFKGVSVGTISYTTVLGAEMTIPAFNVDEITR